MKRFRKSTWVMLIWTALCAVITVARVSQSVTETSDLSVGQPVQVDETFQVTLTSTAPPTLKIENLTTKNETFSYSNVKMMDSAGLHAARERIAPA